MSERSARPCFSAIITGCVFAFLLMMAVPSHAQEVTRKSETTLTNTLGGFFGGVWDGVVDVVTLKPVFGDDEEPVPSQKISTAGQTPYESSSRAIIDDKGSMSRMMGRMAGFMGGDNVEKDEYGLPKRY